MNNLVDIDDSGSWPSDVSTYAKKWAQLLGGRTKYAADLEVPLEEVDEFRQLFREYRLKAFHCTRLLDHERVWVSQQGLRMASQELISDRIQAAFDAGSITTSDRDSLLSSHALVAGARRIGSREGQVCFVASRSVFDHAPSGVRPLLQTWGGEIIYNPQRDRATLRAIGKPTIVVAALDVSSPPTGKRHFFTPELNKLFVAKQLQLNVAGDIFFRTPVEATDIVAILQPGDKGYDQHQQLPQT